MSQIRNFKLSGGASDIPATSQRQNFSILHRRETVGQRHSSDISATKYLDFTQTGNGLPATSQRHPSDISATKYLDFTQTRNGLPATSQRQNISTFPRRETVCQRHLSDISATNLSLLCTNGKRIVSDISATPATFFAVFRIRHKKNMIFLYPSF